jgi:hypothetical protein
MKPKDIKCTCGGIPKISGSDYTNEEGPWQVVCQDCGKETVLWAYQREAWAQWKVDMKGA